MSTAPRRRHWLRRALSRIFSPRVTSTRNLDIPIGRLARMLAVSALIGVSLYSALMWWTLTGLKNAVLRADVFQTLLAQDPYQVQGVPGQPPLNRVVEHEQGFDKKVPDRRTRIVELMQLLKVIDDDAAIRLRAEIDRAGGSPDVFEKHESRLVADLFEAREFGKYAFSPSSRHTLELIVAAASVGPKNCGADAAAFGSTQIDRLADAIAQVPGPLPGFGNTGLARDYVALAARAVDLDGPGKPAIDCTDYFQVPRWGRLLSHATFSPPEPVSDGQLLEALLTSYRLVDTRGLNWPGPTISDPSERLAAQAMLRKFLTSLLSEVRADPEVRKAQLWVTVIRGWEQAGMLVLAVFVAWLLRVRYRETEGELDRLDTIAPRIARRSAGRDVEASRRAAAEAVSRETASTSEQSRSLVTYLASMARNYASGGPHTERRADEFRAVCDLEARSLFSSGWPIRTALALIPALGFLGTVRGILLALADIDSIVRAGSTFDQAAAVSQIGTSLGLAFATTAVALVLGLLFRVISDYQTAREEALVQDCESMFTPLVDPTLGEQPA